MQKEGTLMKMLTLSYGPLWKTHGDKNHIPSQCGLRDVASNRVPVL